MTLLNITEARDKLKNIGALFFVSVNKIEYYDSWIGLYLSLDVRQRSKASDIVVILVWPHI